ncbi:MAG: metallophosphoesterase family protein [Thermaceae bacterium]
MRILHTADWHLGKLLKGVDRTPEVAEALEGVLEIVQKERVDLVLVAGDLFDRPQVPVEAEEEALRFFLRLHELEVPALVIAGNHDSGRRLEVWGQLLKRFGVTVRGEAKVRGEGGVVDRPLRAGLLPFLSERKLLSFQEGELSEWRGQYAEKMAKLMRHLTQEGEELLLAHLTVEGAKPGGGEFAFYISNAYAVSPQGLPYGPRYIALGHIHRQQQVAENAWYSGSLIQLDFGEGEEDPRGVILVELPERGPARVHPIRERWGRPLRTFRLKPEELDAKDGELRRFGGYIRLLVEGDLPPVLQERLYRELPGLLDIQPVQSPQEGASEAPVEEMGDVVEAYGRYLEERGRLKPELLDRFRQVLMEVEGAAF